MLSRPCWLRRVGVSQEGLRKRWRVRRTGGTSLPIVLHGSSGVRSERILAAICAGVRKINVETAIRAAFVDALRSTLEGGGSAARKPRYLTMATDLALGQVIRGLLLSYSGSGHSA